MANTIRPYTGDGTTVLYPVDFDLGYIRKAYIYVYLEGNDFTDQLDYTYISDTQIQLTTPVASGTVFNIRRVVPRHEIVNDYEDGAAMHEENLDDSFKQAIMALEEIQDGYTDPSGVASFNSNIDLNNKHKVINSIDPTDDGDLVSLSYLKQFVLSEQGGLNYVERSEAAAESAEEDADDTEELFLQFRDDYAGHGSSLPSIENDGTLFYYDGPDFTQGLYIYYDNNVNAFTGRWSLVSGVGPQGATGAEGIQGAIGLQGEQGIQGQVGIQGQQGIQGALGDTGPQGIQGETGATGPQGIQGILGPDGPNGPQGVQGVQGPRGETGIQGTTGNTGATGDSFQVDATGSLVDRDAYDAELEGFSFLALDAQAIEDAVANFERWTGDGATTDYLIPFTPDGQQSLQLVVAGVVQTPDMYTVLITTNPDTWTVQFNEAPLLGMSIVAREFSLATGYGEIYFKNTDSLGDWSVGIPFGRGPRGDQGDQGPIGNQGVQGDQGVIGNSGPQGPQGNVGVQGPQGSTGNLGPQGAQGPGGDRGPVGIQGPQGDEGTQGIQGEQGILGATGPQGPQGAVGDQGARGDQGAIGPTGSKGAIGTDGADGRSSSGRVFIQATVTPPDSGSSSVQLRNIEVVNSQVFDRVLRVSGLFHTTVFSTSSAPNSIRVFGLFQGSTTYSGETIVKYDGATSYAEVPPLYITIPAGETGTIFMNAQRTATNTTDEDRVSGGGPANGGETGEYLVELYPKSTELE